MSNYAYYSEKELNKFASSLDCLIYKMKSKDIKEVQRYTLSESDCDLFLVVYIWNVPILNEFVANDHA